MKTTTSAKLYLEKLKAKIEKTEAILKEESIKQLLESQNEVDQIKKDIQEQKDKLDEMINKSKDIAEEEAKELSSMAEKTWDGFVKKWNKYVKN